VSKAVFPARDAPSSPHGVRATLGQAKLNRQEIAGSLGDLGTFLPLLVGMTVQNGLNFATALLFAGLFNLVTGLLFTVPMAVQPMKAIAAIAITEGLSVSQIVAAGAIVSALVLLLGITGLVDWLNRIIPPSVVRGLQLAVGLSLAIKGLQMVAKTDHWLAADGYLVAIAAALVAILLAGSRRLPAALLLFAAGLGLAAWTDPQLLRTLGLGFTFPHWNPPALHDLLPAFRHAALPQLPLTTLNSVIAVCALSTTLFPDRPVTPRRVAVSVGLMNLVGVWFGAMPMCHGAGGLAGQYRFGARSNGSILFLGSTKILLAILFGSSLLALAMAFPASILGVMLACSGIELASSIRDESQQAGWWVLLLTAGACLGLQSIALGFAVGLMCHWLLRLSARVDRRSA
jgi:MFS superfamily sulfate permease-like transporter